MLSSSVLCLVSRAKSCAAFLPAASLAGVLLSGCGGGGSSALKAGPITVTGASGSGSAKSIVVSTTASVSMAAMNDQQNDGIDWTVTCGGNPVTGALSGGACGTFTPVHTPSGATSVYTAPALVPIGNFVTITGSLTSNPAFNSSTTLAIFPLPITVAIGSAPTALATNGQAVLSATTGNDVNGNGVNWSASCSTGICGTFGVPAVQQMGSTTGSTYATTVTYSAPSTPPGNGVVTIIATSISDPGRSASTTIQVGASSSSGSGPISITVLPAQVNVGTTSGRQVSLVGSVMNDTTNLGIDWKLQCASTNCGQLQSAHTASGAAEVYQGPNAVPPGGTATITATSSADPTQSVSVPVAISTTAPIMVTMTSKPPATVATQGTAALSATVSNDSAGKGVDWTAICGSAGNCGSFSLSPAHTASGGSITYTAPSSIPSGGIVTILATSSATTASDPAVALTTIAPPSPSIAFGLEPPASMTAGTQTPVSAVVNNDVTSAGGVTWTVHCNNTADGACGSILPYHTASGAKAIYTAPPAMTAGTTITINATSTANPAASASSTSIAITPSTALSVGFVPAPPAQIQQNATVNLVAAVSNDTSHAGVDWQVCASGCGFFTIKPDIPAVPATETTPYRPEIPAVAATTVTAWPDGVPLPYTAPAHQPSYGPVAMLIAAHASAAVTSSASITITPQATGPAINGKVLAGTQPVAAASVSLYAAGVSGYASPASLLYAPNMPPSVVTDVNGVFSIPAGYTCPQPNSQVYLVARGGLAAGNDAKSSANGQLAMMTALGSCATLSSSSLVVNEVTTVASVWTLAPFAANDALTGNPSYLYLGTSGTNVTGLVNAFASINNLVDITTGQAKFTVPAGNASAPYVRLNTLADIFNACTAGTGGAEADSSPCGSLLASLDPLSYGKEFHPTSPTDTLQAAFNMAQHPSGGGAFGYEMGSASSLYALASLGSPFQPMHSTAPVDWSLSLNFAGGGGLSSSSAAQYFALDAQGNLWLTDNNANTLIEWSNTGAPVSPATGFAVASGPVAVDASGNIWISGDPQLFEVNSLATPIPGSPFLGITGSNDIAFDGLGNLWVANGAGVAKFDSLGQELSPQDGYLNPELANTTSLTVDNSNNMRVAGAITISSNDSGLGVVDLFNSSGQVEAATPTGGINRLTQIVADSSGNVWVPTGLPTSQSSLCKLPAYAGNGAFLIWSCYDGGPYVGGVAAFNDIVDPEGIALDGAGTLWIASPGQGTAVTPPNITEVVPGLVSETLFAAFVSPSLSVGTLRAAVDSSGNVWVLLANNTVTEYVGVATPAVTPLALAVKNKKVGAEP